MTSPFPLFLDLLTAATITRIVVGAAVGVALGALHFRALWSSLRGADNGGSGHQVVAVARRWSVTVIGLTALALMGAPALLSGALGLLAARHVVLRRIGRGT